VGIKIGPTEKRDVHIKVYVEPSIMEALKKYQIRNGLYSISEAVRGILMHQLRDED
jgi:hypothetical protein